MIQTHLHRGILTITLDRPEKRNALSMAMMQKFKKTIQEADDAVRVIIIKGAGPIFCSGLDLTEVQNPKAILVLEDLLKTLYDSPKITIASVHGSALAGGAGLMSICDFALVETETKLSFTEVRRGIVPALVTALLAQQLAPRHVSELMLTGESITAQRAYEIGWINAVYPHDQLEQETIKLAYNILKGAPITVTLTKELLRKTEKLTKDLDMSLSFHERAENTEEKEEGAAAFLEKRKPFWEILN